MAEVVRSSTLVTNLAAVPPKINDCKHSHGRLRLISDTIEIGSTDSDNSIYRMVPVYSSWSIKHVWLWNDAVSGGSDFDLGVYLPSGDGGAAVDVNAFADAVDMSSARVAPLDLAFEVRDIANINQQVWQAAGLAVDPKRFYDLAFTAITIGSGGGTLTLAVHYTDGS